MKKSIILTGPNAAGKTTMLKSTIINLLFSQPCHSEKPVFRMQRSNFNIYRTDEIPSSPALHGYLASPHTKGWQVMTEIIK